jgi:hypothetical protein
MTAPLLGDCHRRNGKPKALSALRASLIVDASPTSPSCLVADGDRPIPQDAPSRGFKRERVVVKRVEVEPVAGKDGPTVVLSQQDKPDALPSAFGVTCQRIGAAGCIRPSA